MIPESLYKEILRVIPLLCIDLVIQDQLGNYLLVKRTNHPLKGEWWVVGGRILHGEHAEHAARRKLKEELGLEVTELRFVGYYEDKFEQNSFEDGHIYHTLSLVFHCRIADGQKIRLDNQASEWRWANTLPQRFKVNCSTPNLA